ncbi:ubiquitin-conjugating enzyme E2 Q2 [Podospora aff. communis PSN243]|uniref:Ubiquitin-conjugating enzyme E2 Q2 n=1 Tax=Podospora aff. communis PSN243 TaxID=3040156 RepID=A0AAV9H8C3_9PEZI|nr:ubiquitin-conjugating enzyme E2 Q2 [Podospora aff. communis PSN243]
MSLKRLKADISAAKNKIASGSLSGVASISAVSDDEVMLTYHHNFMPRAIRIHAIAQNPSEYPEDSSFMLFTKDADAQQLLNEDGKAHQLVIDTIQNTQDFLFAMSVYEMAAEISKQLNKSFNESRAKTGDDGDDSEDAINSDFSGDEDADDFDEGDDYAALEDEAFGLASGTQANSHTASAETMEQICLRIRADLRQVREAGYKVGLLDSLGRDNPCGILSISIRVSKLGLSDEALEAWDVGKDDYFVLLVRYENKYEALDDVVSKPASSSRVVFRVGKCKQYKPSLRHAVAAFAGANHAKTPHDLPEDVHYRSSTDTDDSEFHKVFVSNSLDQFMNDSFVSLLKIRETMAVSWDAANEHLIKRTGLGIADSRGIAEYLEEEIVDATDADESHRLLHGDHLVDNDLADQRSFPLVAAQFAIRYFVKCTEYCLRCHRRLGKEFEALRPYVCSEPLCLFQYLNMGFGPSIEHEITTQPYVVDLLVSLCYAAIQHSGGYSRAIPQPSSINPTNPTHLTNPADSQAGHTDLPIRSLPVGLRLQVPDLHQKSPSSTPPLAAHRSGNKLLIGTNDTLELDTRLAVNTWVALRIPNQALVHHAVITAVQPSNRTVFLHEVARSGCGWGPGVYGYDYPTYNNGQLQGQPVAARTQGGQEPLESDVEVFFYDTDFDGLDGNVKGEAMRHILDTLPSIIHMESFLNNHPHTPIRSVPGVSPAAACLLQWIVSSNRSCIYQIDHTRDVVTNETTEQVSVGRGRNREKERIPGMDGWVQFKFAQGSPDKELRFKRALQEVAARRTIATHPTIFAWHGSGVSNWHSIVRTGLDFKDVRCGRAFGNGVYFSPHHGTSLGYVAAGAQAWPNSELAISTCMSLNEIVNAPDEFVSKTPHYVVSQLDWHQCRYLFVKSGAMTRLPVQQDTASTYSSSASGSNGPYHKQPSSNCCLGPNGKELRIPLSAIPFRHVGPEPVKQGQSSKRDLKELGDDSSDDEDEDTIFLYSDEDASRSGTPPNKRVTTGRFVMGKGKGRGKGTISNALPPSPAATEKGLTDFEPGTLDWSTLPRLQEPLFSNPMATGALARELKKLQALQSKTPLHELGWYMDFDRIDNVYQWIVELHTFEKSLPLAQDMKAAGITSVVMEIRFPKDFPMQPPFVRVIRPRFLPFMNGGGGHVTGGGAMCMELLTNTGWSPANSMESVLLQVRLALCNLEPRPARIQSVVYKGQPSSDYGVVEAVDAYVRAVNQHGWSLPPDFRATANQSSM